MIISANIWLYSQIITYYVNFIEKENKKVNILKSQAAHRYKSGAPPALWYNVGVLFIVGCGTLESVFVAAFGHLFDAGFGFGVR